MPELRPIEVKCCNPECPQKIFNITRKVAEPGAKGQERVAVTCPYCQKDNMVHLPAEVVETRPLLRGAPIEGDEQ